MNTALKRTDNLAQGVHKRSVENSLQLISDQMRWIEQKLTMKIENEITKGYENTQRKIGEVEFTIKEFQKNQ